jgi:hypothetical protein
MMRFYEQQHQFYGGIDLHSRNMRLCVLDPQGAVRYEASLPTSPTAFLDAVAPVVTIRKRSRIFRVEIFSLDY